MRVCEIQLFDETLDNFRMTCWDEEMILLAQRWRPFHTVLLLCDIKLQFQDFHGTMGAQFDRKTILIVDPNMQEAEDLVQYAQTNLVQARLNNTQVSVDTVGELLGVILTFHFRLSCFS
eukprot:m.185137 g.185137  ORF g.185137 m.185137 type:complete len:119 (-) comp25557_c0_seq11:101-457(-)